MACRSLPPQKSPFGVKCFAYIIRVTPFSQHSCDNGVTNVGSNEPIL